MITIREAMEAHALRLAEQIWPSVPAPTVRVAEEGPRAWFVLQTVSRGEAAALEGLAAAGYEAYQPMMLKDIVHHRSKKWVTRAFPLFNRFVFAELPADPSRWSPVRAIREIEKALGAEGRPCPVSVAEVERIRAAQLRGEFDERREGRRARLGKTFRPGRRIVVTEGPFGGFAGRVERINASGTLQVLLDIFARLTPVEIDAASVEPA